MRPKHPLVAALLLSAIAPAQAAVAPELSIHGYAAGSLRYLETDFEKGEDQFEGSNNASRLSAKAGVKFDQIATWLIYERGLKNDKAGIEAERQAYLAVDTPYGQLRAGKKASEYRLSGERLDPFYDTSVTGFNGRAQSEGASYGLSNLTNGHSRNMLAYASPLLFEGLQVNGAVFKGNQDPLDNQTDVTGGASWTQAGFGGEGRALTIGAQYLKIDNPSAFSAGNPVRNERVTVGGSPGISTSYRAFGAYTTAKFSLGASYENVDVKAEPEARRYYYLAGSYALSETLRAALSYGRLDFAAGSPALSGNGYSLGLFRKLGESTNAYIAARQVSLDASGDTTSLAAGLSVNFDIKLVPWSFGGGGGGDE